jgi:hypothetical protein
MTQYEDLPEEVAELLVIEDVAIPVAIRMVIGDGWDAMDFPQQKLLIEKMKQVKEPIKRTLIAVFETSKVLLTQPPEDIIY